MKRYDYRWTYDGVKVEEDPQGEYVKHDEAHALLKEAYESIVENHKNTSSFKDDECIHCCKTDRDMTVITHEPDCIVLKATEYLEGEG